VGRIYWEERAKEKFRNHGRNSPALPSILIVWAFFFFPLPGLTLPQNTDSNKNPASDNVIVGVVDGVMVNFMSQLDWATIILADIGQTLLGGVCEDVSG
jgi:hypothetical protein